MEIEEITSKLFNVDYEKDFEDDNVSEEYLKLSKRLINKYSWHNVYLCWYNYLIKNCNTEKEIINFANLFWFYEGYKQYIPNAIDFCAYFYANISIEIYIENEPVIDGISWNVLTNSGIYSKNELYFENFEPYNDKNIIEAIKKYKGQKQNGLH